MANLTQTQKDLIKKTDLGFARQCAAQMYGTNNAETLNAKNDLKSWVIQGFGENDIINGSLTHGDYLDGGKGNDIIQAYGGNDKVVDIYGANNIHLGDGNDVAIVTGGTSMVDLKENSKGSDVVVVGDNSENITISSFDLNKDTIVASNEDAKIIYDKLLLASDIFGTYAGYGNWDYTYNTDCISDSIQQTSYGILHTLDFGNAIIININFNTTLSYIGYDGINFELAQTLFNNHSFISYSELGFDPSIYI